MRARWEGVHADLLRSVSTLEAERQFNEIKDASLGEFTSPASLVAYLNDPDGDLDEKDRIYDLLVGAVQSRNDRSDLAAAILWLGLWPALDRIYRRRLHRFMPEVDELVEAIGLSFTVAIGRVDLERSHRLAATLTMNTHRDVTEVLKRRGRDAGGRADLPQDDRLAEQREVAPAFLARGGAEEQEIASMRGRLLPIVGPRDVDLVLAVVLGETQKEAGARQGLSHDVSRKRYERAIERIRAVEPVVVPFPLRKVRF